MDLGMLNRLRVNAGKPELAAWKASKAKLGEAIKSLQDAGFLDTLPGANIQAKPITDDPVVAKTLPEAQEPELPKDTRPSKGPTVTNGKAKLGRGLETEPMARQSRVAVQMERDREKKEADAAKKEAKAHQRAEAKAPPPNAKSSAAKKEAKKADRPKIVAALKTPKHDPNKEVTVADICRELDIDPKIGRAKLRRHQDKLDKLYAKGVTSGWTFPKGVKAELISILK